MTRSRQPTAGRDSELVGIAVQPRPASILRAIEPELFGTDPGLEPRIEALRGLGDRLGEGRRPPAVPPAIGSPDRPHGEAAPSFLPECDAALSLASAGPPVTRAEPAERLDLRAGRSAEARRRQETAGDRRPFSAGLEEQAEAPRWEALEPLAGRAFEQAGGRAAARAALQNVQLTFARVAAGLDERFAPAVSLTGGGLRPTATKRRGRPAEVGEDPAAVVAATTRVGELAGSPPAGAEP